MITGIHALLFSKQADEVRAFFRDVLGFESVDAGSGWLIFALPPSEVAVHPAEETEHQEMYLMCDSIDAFIAEMKRHNITCSEPRNMGWGVLTQITLPGGGKLGVYQPRHARP